MNYFRLLLLSFCILSVIPADGQGRRKYSPHEIGIGVGVMGRSTDVIRNVTYFDEDHTLFYYDDYYSGSGSSKWDVLEKSKYYYSGMKSTPSFFGRYFYAPYDWLQFGATLSYNNVSQEKYETVSRRSVSKASTHYVSLIPTIRLNFVRGNAFRMYGSVGVGYTMAMVKDYDQESFKNYNVWATDITFLGISFGKDIYFSGEFGLYTCGYAKFVAGYRF